MNTQVILVCRSGSLFPKQRGQGASVRHSSVLRAHPLRDVGSGWLCEDAVLRGPRPARVHGQSIALPGSHRAACLRSWVSSHRESHALS